MAEGGRARYCPQCGHVVGAEDRFCNNCGYTLSVPPLGEGRIETERVNVPPPPAPATPAQDGLGGFLRSFGLGAGACLGMAVALTLLLVIGLGGCAVLLAGSGGAGEDASTSTSATANGEKREATGQGSLDDLIQKQVGDFTLQTNEPLKSKPKSSTESRQTTYKSSDGTQVNHVVGFVIPKYAYSANTTESEGFANGFLEAPESIKKELGGVPKRSEFQVEDENGKQVGRGLLLEGTQSEYFLWTNERLTGAVKAPTGYGQNFYDELPY